MRRAGGVWGLLLAFLVLAKCAGDPATPDAGKVIEDTERGFRFTLPPAWVYFGNEVRSRQGTIMSIDVHSLEGAERRFVEGLPDTLVPQLEAWARSYFAVVEAPSRGQLPIGGRAATELGYRVQVRPTADPTQLTYWVVRYDDKLLVLRVVYPARATADEPAVRSMLASWSFLESEREPLRSPQP